MRDPRRKRAGETSAEKLLTSCYPRMRPDRKTSYNQYKLTIHPEVRSTSVWRNAVPLITD